MLLLILWAEDVDDWEYQLLTFHLWAGIGIYPQVYLTMVVRVSSLTNPNRYGHPCMDMGTKLRCARCSKEGSCSCGIPMVGITSHMPTIRQRSCSGRIIYNTKIFPDVSRTIFHMLANGPMEKNTNPGRKRIFPYAALQTCTPRMGLISQDRMPYAV